MEAIAGGLFLGVGLLFYIIIMIFTMGISVATYVLMSLGLRGMAIKFGMPNPNYAFIPVYNIYFLGKIATEAARRNGGKQFNYGKILMWLIIVILILSLVMPIIITVISLGGTAAGAYTAESIASNSASWNTLMSTDPDTDISTGVFTIGALGVVGALVIVLFTFALTAISVVYQVFYYIALWQIYNCFAHDNAVLYMVLSVFISVALPILFFMLRNSEPRPAPAPAF